MSRHQHAAQHVDDLHQEHEDPISALMHREHDGLNVIFEKDARDGSVRHNLALLRHGVLVRKDVARAHTVDGRHDGEVVLELVEVVLGNVGGAVERVDQRGVKGPVGQLRDDVREVELWY